MKYRPEIDGLRAIAVSVVVLYHAGLKAFSGGFVGVDIFFVISGFLITGIIIDQRESGKFSYWLFIERRIRRILPALSVVMLVIAPVGAWLMLPDPLENFGQSLVASAFSANNILLTLTSGYWDLASEFKPLLHTWSLGIEEQFYILYPLFLIALLALRAPVAIAVVSVIAMASFGLMVFRLEAAPDAAFYLLQYRAWELLIGALAALVVWRFRPKPRLVLCVSGFAFVLLAVFGGGLTQSLMPYSLLVACMGTLLFLVFSGPEHSLTRALTWRPVVFVGLISYSLYLWHQPVFAFLRIGSFGEPGTMMMLGGALLAIMLAIISWQYVEKPFRDRDKTSRSFVLGSVGLSIAGIAGLGLAMHFSSGFPSRMDGADGSDFQAGATIIYNERVWQEFDRDFEQADQDRFRIALFGNSFARDFANVLIEAGVTASAEMIYRADIGVCANVQKLGSIQGISEADLIIFASGEYSESCVAQMYSHVERVAAEADLLFVGPKHFGRNLNPLVRMSASERAETRLEIPEHVVALNESQARALQSRYVDLLMSLSQNGAEIRVADDYGRLLTTDRIHLSKAGAQYLAREIGELSSRLAMLVPASDAPAAAD